MQELDRIDLKILDVLQREGQIPAVAREDAQKISRAGTVEQLRRHERGQGAPDPQRPVAPIDARQRRLGGLCPLWFALVLGAARSACVLGLAQALDELDAESANRGRSAPGSNIRTWQLNRQRQRRVARKVYRLP